VSGHLPVADRRTVAGWLRRVRAGHGRTLALVLGAYTLSVAASLATGPIIGRLVSAAVHHDRRVPLVPLMALGTALLVAQTLLTRYARLRARVLGEELLAQLREDVMRRALALPMGVVEEAGVGDLLTRTTRDIAAVARNFRFTVFELLGAVLVMGLTVVALGAVDPLYVLPCLVSLVLSAAVTRWYLRRAPGWYLAESQAYADVSEGLVETGSHPRTVEALDLGDLRVRRTDGDLARVFRAGLRTLNLRTTWLPAVGLLCLLPLPAVLLTGFVLHSHGHATVAAVTTAAVYAQQFGEPVNRVSYYVDDLHLAYTALARLLGLPAPPGEPVLLQRVPARPPLTASAVRFSYDGERDVLHGVDLELRPGETLALIGPSGAGKTTLATLLAGARPPSGGDIRLAGVPLGALPAALLRRRVALVSQEHHVFATTLRDNVALAGPRADATVWSALHAVGADSWARRLPQGIATRVGAGGVPLDARQAQQVALARVLAGEPDVIVLDEATADLDHVLARRLEEALASRLRDRTVVTVAHRLHTARDADRIAVVADGRITELGSHDELLALDGAYARLWRTWARRTPARGRDAERVTGSPAPRGAMPDRTS
jgi:ABC-type multidrug transport system fused ATPase/permease subunit